MEKKIFERFMSRKGQIVSLTYTRPLKTLKKFNNLKVTKFGVMQARVGINYENIQAVQQKRETGELPPVNQGLPFGSWEYFPYTIKHTIKHNNKRYLRFSTLPNQSAKVIYFVNDKEVTAECAKALCLSSEFQEKNDLDVFVMNEENILDLK